MFYVKLILVVVVLKKGKIYRLCYKKEQLKLFIKNCKIFYKTMYFINKMKKKKKEK